MATELVQLLLLLWLFFPCPVSLFPFLISLLAQGSGFAGRNCILWGMDEALEGLSRFLGGVPLPGPQEQLTGCTEAVPPTLTCHLISHQRQIFCSPALSGCVNVI